MLGGDEGERWEHCQRWVLPWSLDASSHPCKPHGRLWICRACRCTNRCKMSADMCTVRICALYGSTPVHVRVSSTSKRFTCKKHVGFFAGFVYRFTKLNQIMQLHDGCPEHDVATAHESVQDQDQPCSNGRSLFLWVEHCLKDVGPLAH